MGKTLVDRETTFTKLRSLSNVMWDSFWHELRLL
jgi:hypothetical protein